MHLITVLVNFEMLITHPKDSKPTTIESCTPGGRKCSKNASGTFK